MSLTVETAINHGKYVLEAQLGKDLFGITYRAINTQSSETVVIKTLTETLCQHSNFAQFKQKFLEIAERLSYCQHPNLVQVLDYFEDSGRPYMAMAYIPGQTLAELIQSEVLSPAKAIEYIHQIGEALSVLHQASLLHLNVQPQNIIRRQDSDSVVLCEFGIACEFTPGIMQTHASLVAGFAPLELYSFKAQRSPATDLYALAATLYCLLTGHPPIPAPVRKALYSKRGVSKASVQGHRFFLPNRHSNIPPLSPTLKQVIGRGLQMAASKRLPTVEAWLDLLKNHEKIPLPQPTLARHSVVQPRGVTNVPILQNAEQGDGIQQLTSQELSPSLSPQPRKSLCLSQVEWNLKAVPKKLKPPKLKLLLQALLMTGVIAASAGAGFGFALRINGSTKPGSTILHTKQAFPPTSKWPNSEPDVEPRL